MILDDVQEVKIGVEVISKIYLGVVLIWPELPSPIDARTYDSTIVTSDQTLYTMDETKG